MKRIFWLSFILLFAEILALRWLSVEFPVIRAFPNLIIMICLVAASAGIAKTESFAGNTKKALALVSSACVLIILPMIFSVPLGLPEFSIKLGDTGEQSNLIRSLGLLTVIVASLYVVFHRIGACLGKDFKSEPPLVAYSSNLLGSIAGTVAFAIISWMGLAPPVWLAVAGAVCFYLYRNIAVIALTVVLAGTAFTTSSQSFWSPYSKLDLHPLVSVKPTPRDKDNYALYSNNGYFHLAFHILDPGENEKDFAVIYSNGALGDLVWNPYPWLQLPIQTAPKHDRVVVLGSGSGQDVAYQLRHGVKHITAIEIDPIIVRLGRERHPDKPYADPRVDIRNEDARTFLRYSKDKFDVVEFAFLDPGRTINSASFLRVDNFVYTVEAMKAAVRLCDTSGVVCVEFATGANSPITARMYQSCLEANGGIAPVSYTCEKAQSCLFIFGPGQNQVHLTDAQIKDGDLKPYKPTGEIRSCTDQWPFLYLAYDPSGIWLYITVLVVSIVLPAFLLLREGKGEISGSEWANMFFLGQAFMLMETKSITHLSLLLGATWIVSSAVIVTVLIFAWVANLLVSKKLAPPTNVAFALLFISLTIQVFVQIPETSLIPPMLVTVIYCIIDCLPIMFGSMIFSSCFGKTKFSTQALSANLMGVAMGGLTENLCIFTGTSNLTYIAMVLYALSFVARQKLEKSSAKGASEVA